jgi:hypothetical protein
LAKGLQTLMTETAERVGKTSGFVHRQSKLTAGLFVQMLVFGWLARPQASREELAQAGASVGLSISQQGLDERLSEEAAEFMRQMVGETLAQVFYSDPVAVGVFQRFNGVYVIDSTVLPLPSALVEEWPGCGEGQASLKLPTQWNLSSGELRVYLSAGRVHDQKTPVQHGKLPAGALRLADLGFLDLDVLQDLAQGDVLWLLRLKVGLALFNPAGEPLDVAATVAQTEEPWLDLPVQVGQEHRLPARLVCQRLPSATAQERRRKLRCEAKRRGQTVSAARLTLADWNLYLTNAPLALLNTREALVVATVRWQIELLYKLWKSESHLNHSRSSIPHKILCEVFAKLIGVVIQHWVCLVRLWALPNRSLVHAARSIRAHALGLLRDLPVLPLFSRALRILTDALARGCRIHKSRQRIPTFRRLLALA